MLNKCKIVLCLQTFDSMFLQNRSFKITHEQKNIRKMHKWFCDQLLWKGAGSNPYQDLLLYLTKCSKANLIKWKWPRKSDRYPSLKYSKKLRIHPFTRNIFCFSNIDQIFSTSDISFLLYIPKQNIFLPLFSMPLLPRKKSLSKSF